VLDVWTDIMPGSETNPINPRSRGVIPVAILGCDSLDVEEIDPSTLRFGPWAAEPAHDLGHPDIHAGHLEDVDGDGDTDLVAHFYTQETGISCGDTGATLTGELLNGRPLEGTDSIETKGCW
jgi:hypothetical protein